MTFLGDGGTISGKVVEVEGSVVVVVQVESDDGDGSLLQFWDGGVSVGGGLDLGGSIARVGSSLHGWGFVARDLDFRGGVSTIAGSASTGDADGQDDKL